MTTRQIISSLLRRDITTEAFIIKNRMKSAIGRPSDEKRTDFCFICVEQFHGVFPNGQIKAGGVNRSE